MHSVRLTGNYTISLFLNKKNLFYLVWQGAQIKVCISISIATRCAQVIKFWGMIMFLLLQHMIWKSWVSLLERLFKTRLDSW